MARDQLAHLNKILRAVRNVNQLIVTEKDPERLLQGACERLVEARSCRSAWIALLDDSGQLVTAAESGFGDDFAPMLEQLQQGIIPQCGKDALANPGVIAVFDPQRDCSGCPLAASCAGRVGSAVRLAYGGKVFGFLVLALQSKYAQDPEERALILEVAGDLGFALHDLEIEEERQQSEERYRLIVRNAHSGIIIVDERYRFQWVNDMFCEMLARDEAEIVGRDFRDFLDDESRQLVADRYVRRQRGEDVPSRYEFNVVRKDGTKRRVEIRSEVVRDRAGRMRTIAQLLDITDRVRAQDALREENRMTLALSRSAGAVVSSLNMREALDHILDELQHVVQADAGSVMLVEGGIARIVGARAYNSSVGKYDVLGHTFVISQTPNLCQMMDTGLPVIVTDTSADPQWVRVSGQDWLRSYAGVPIRAHDKTLGFLNVDRTAAGPFGDKTIERLGVFASITGAAIEKATLIEEANRRADRLETAQRVGRMGFLDWDLKTDKILLSDEVCRIYGLKKGEDMTTPELVAQVVHEDDREHVRNSLELVLSGEKNYDIDHRIVRPDGKVLWVHAQGQLLRDDAGNPEALLATVVDITSRKEAEAKLRKSLSDIMCVLTATIEIRDPYTAGHQLRVAKLAVAVATEMKLSEDLI
ncbi:MAG TPA: PAS domain S-box protein, partial [Candidatus Acetothermia bacterium]|nr:PAS domain S-box protein [Candidatus Acetothermia bacterium]